MALIKAISLWQPWASYIPEGIKYHETRSWYTSYIGDLLICSAKKKSRDLADYHDRIRSEYRLNMQGFYDLPFGEVVALVTMTDCIKMTTPFIVQQPPEEIATGDWLVGRFAWKLENIRKPKRAIAVIGRQGFFDVDVSLNDFEGN
ncbi:ASCH domain-containing protein [Nostoc sp.]|uniref:ASCH domain-containing protein n=1 Tax=Nostoc sp. TaxID=1180 RepID=UPI002FF4FA2D